MVVVFGELRGLYLLMFGELGVTHLGCPVLDGMLWDMLCNTMLNALWQCWESHLCTGDYILSATKAPGEVGCCQIKFMQGLMSQGNALHLSHISRSCAQGFPFLHLFFLL